MWHRYVSTVTGGEEGRIADRIPDPRRFPKLHDRVELREWQAEESRSNRFYVGHRYLSRPSLYLDG